MYSFNWGTINTFDSGKMKLYGFLDNMGYDNPIVQGNFFKLMI